MKYKKYLLILLVIFIVSLSGCFSKEEINDYVEVVFYDGDMTTIIQKSKVLKGEDVVYEGKTPKLYIEGKIVTFINWDKPLSNIICDTEFYPQFEVTDIYYTVNFYDYDKSLLDTFTVKHNDSLDYDKIPTRQSDEYRDYEFYCWYNYRNKTTENIKEDLDFYAWYNETYHSYDVKFLDDDGAVLEKMIVKSGDYATYTGKTPTKEAIESGIYTFTGFSPDPSNVIIDRSMTFVANYSFDEYEYDVVFKDEDGSVLYQTQVSHGSSCKYPFEEPTKDSDNPQYYYKFSYWIPSGDYSYYTNVKENREFIAKYSQFTTTFTVTFKDNYKDIHTLKVKYGELATVPSGLTGPKDGYTRDFIGWDFDFTTPIYSDTIIYAKWSDWYYTKDGLGHEYVDDTAREFTIKCGNLNYKTFLITHKNIVIKDEDGKFYSAIPIGVSNKGFYNNDMIEKIVFDDIPTIVNIGYAAFSNCDNLEIVILNEYITRIEREAFRACENIKILYLPASLVFLGDSSFSFTNIEKLFYGGTYEQWQNIEREGYPRLVPDTIYYYSEEEPVDDEYNYWHYIDGVMTPWE